MLLLLVLMSWLAATISGVAGFGGALILLPFLTNIVGLKAAVPILTLAQLIGNASRVWFGREHIRWRLVGYFAATAIPTSVAGSLLFADLPTKPITFGIGVLLLVIVGLRRLRITQFNFGERGLLLGGALTGLLSGLAGSAGPLGAAFFLGLNLPAMAYVASEAVTALAMHLTKSLIYQRYALMGLQELGYGLLMGVGMVVGSWTGKRLIERLPRHKFVVLIEMLLAVSALQLILTASR
jgi:hypothetical protein